jgi:hypothetical protein
VSEREHLRHTREPTRTPRLVACLDAAKAGSVVYAMVVRDRVGLQVLGDRDRLHLIVHRDVVKGEVVEVVE